MSIKYWIGGVLHGQNVYSSEIKWAVVKGKWRKIGCLIKVLPKLFRDVSFVFDFSMNSRHH